MRTEYKDVHSLRSLGRGVRFKPAALPTPVHHGKAFRDFYPIYSNGSVKEMMVASISNEVLDPNLR